VSKIDRGRDLGDRGAVSHDPLGERPRRQGDHSGAQRRPAVIRPQHDTGSVRAEHRSGRHTARASVVEVSGVQRGMVHLDQHMSDADHWLGYVPDTHRPRLGRVNYQRSYR